MQCTVTAIVHMRLEKVTCVSVLNNSDTIPKILSFDFFLFLSFVPTPIVSLSRSVVPGTKIMSQAQMWKEEIQPYELTCP